MQLAGIASFALAPLALRPHFSTGLPIDLVVNEKEMGMD